MVNVVTHFSQNVDDYDRATELEALGGKLTLPLATGRSWPALHENGRKPAALRDSCPRLKSSPSPDAASRLPGHFFSCQQC